MAHQLMAINPFPSGDEVSAIVRSRLGANDDIAAMDLAGGHAAYMALLRAVWNPASVCLTPESGITHSNFVVLALESVVQQYLGLALRLSPE